MKPGVLIDWAEEHPGAISDLWEASRLPQISDKLGSRIMTTATRYDATSNLPLRVLEAEHDYHDCLTLYGHASAEAHVAEMYWRRLRRDACQARGRLS